MDEVGESGAVGAVTEGGGAVGGSAEDGAVGAAADGGGGVWDAGVWTSTEPWAMQLALDDERTDRPTHFAACEAAAMAVVTLLGDPRTTDEAGAWHPYVARWVSGHIRKVVRRGRGVRFTAVQELPGVLVEHAGARVRAFVPMPVDHVPPALAKLQVGGTDMPDRGSSSSMRPATVTIALTPLVTMTTGKAAAQSGHAAQLALEAMDEAARRTWQEAGFPVRVIQPDEGEWAVLTRSAQVAVHDGGFTEVPPGTRTAQAAW